MSADGNVSKKERKGRKSVIASERRDTAREIVETKSEHGIGIMTAIGIEIETETETETAIVKVAGVAEIRKRSPRSTKRSYPKRTTRDSKKRPLPICYVRAASPQIASRSTKLTKPWRHHRARQGRLLPSIQFASIHLTFRAPVNVATADYGQRGETPGHRQTPKSRT